MLKAQAVPQVFQANLVLLVLLVPLVFPDPLVPLVVLVPLVPRELVALAEQPEHLDQAEQMALLVPQV